MPQLATIGPEWEYGLESSEAVLGGQLVVVGTRIPASTILAYLQDGYSDSQILSDYPSLTRTGIVAVERWALDTQGWTRS